ncbi:MAG: TorF family putative porin [Alphaproteobacteria bacterium]|nr:TorF family putative porin [Alphaproteobacteria bacterium]HPF45663.1 TorF family putative porin [Emcibacteraceae bacterium]
MTLKKIILNLLCLTVLLPAIGQAQTRLLGGELAFNASLLSDYRFRGVSKSNNDVAVQGGIDWFADNGIYTGAWASNVSNFRGADVETNFYAGYSRESHGIIYDIGATAYVYPGGNNATYFETYGSAGVDFGLLTSTLGISYMPSQSNNGSQDNIYLYNETRAQVPNTPFSLNFHLGYEDGFFGNNKWDWRLGTSVTFDKFELGISYVDTNVVGRRSDSGVVFRVAAFF